MRPSFYPRFVNGPFGDPGLFIPFLFERRAFFMDLGDISSVSPRDLLKVTHVFITHTHMDHFVGIDKLIRIFLGRDKKLFTYGPRGFLKNIEGKLAGYSWNLAKEYKTDFTLQATEVCEQKVITKTFICKKGFIPERKDPVTDPFNGILLKEPGLVVHTTILDHIIPCLGFSFTERFHVNIMKNSLDDLGLKAGPWVRIFKQALFNNAPPDSEINILLRNNEKKNFLLKDLTGKIAHITRGQKITYVSDVICSEPNVKKIVELAKDSDQLFIEAAFLEKDKDIAKKKYHLTARQAGCIANMACVKQFSVFHFSPRYRGMEHLLYEEAQGAYAKGDVI